MCLSTCNYLIRLHKYNKTTPFLECKLYGGVMFRSIGAISIALLGRPQGPSEEPAAGRPNQTLRQPQERSSGHQRP